MIELRMLLEITGKRGPYTMTHTVLLLPKLLYIHRIAQHFAKCLTLQISMELNSPKFVTAKV